MAGGDFGDLGRGIAVDASSNAYVTGDTTTTDFPATHTLPGTLGPNNSRIFVARIGAARTGHDRRQSEHAGLPETGDLSSKTCRWPYMDRA
jgi:Beta-propeller repeat